MSMLWCEPPRFSQKPPCRGAAAAGRAGVKAKAGRKASLASPKPPRRKRGKAKEFKGDGEAGRKGRGVYCVERISI
jgi:hypothetical protein